MGNFKIDEKEYIGSHLFEELIYLGYEAERGVDSNLKNLNLIGDKYEF